MSEMRTLIFFALMLALLIGAGPGKNDLYQVVTSHPHVLKELAPHVETVYQNGRLWVVQLNQDAPSHVMEHLQRLKGGEKSYLYAGKYISNKSLKPNPVKIRSYVNSVIVENIRSDVYWLSSFETRYAGTDGNQLATNAVSDRLQRMGYRIQKNCYRSDSCNVIAEKKGSLANSDVVMIMAHIDSVGEYFAGADDNASGISVILEMARVLKDYKNEKTIRFFISNGEELGLIGSKVYASELEAQGEIKNIKLLINMDMVGYNKTGVIELETNPEFEDYAQWMAGLASRYTKLKTKITLGAWGSDHVSFLEKDVPTVQTIEDWDDKSPCYHKECDKPEILNYDYAADVARLNLSAILAKDIE